MLKTIKLTNLLSFGTETEITFNKGLNVLIGANGSGKSNLIEAISLLQAMPRDITKVIRDGGGVQEWLWKGEQDTSARLETIIDIPYGFALPFRHILEFRANKDRVEITDESIENESCYPNNIKPRSYYKNYEGTGEILQTDGTQTIKKEKLTTQSDIDFYQSILAQRQDPYVYPEITIIANKYRNIRLYREWQFGRLANTRRPQRADLPNDYLNEDSINLGLILNKLRRNSETKKRLLEALQLFNENIEDFDVIIEGGTVQVFFHENGFTIPATRLSDGTLRYLSLLAILLHPNPPPLICIEEPELGLHPDILPALIDLLKEAAQKTQIIITTHSSDLIDGISDMPEAVLVFDKYQGSTTVNRLNKEELREWLEEYTLGQLWNKGHIGGNRW